MRDLEGRTAVVTGASSGIGAATAREFASAGANVVLAARRAERLESLAGELRDAHGVDATAVPTDVRVEAEVEELIETAVAAGGGLDILVNNAGVGEGQDVAELSTTEYRTMMEVNADGCFFATRAGLPHLVDSAGHLIFVGSVAGQYARSFNPVYAATKWWVRGFAKSVAAQYGDRDVAVSVVNPSEVRSEWVASDGTAFEDRFEPGEVTEPEEVAEAIAFVAASGPSVPAEIDIYRRDKLADMF